MRDFCTDYQINIYTNALPVISLGRHNILLR